MRKKEEMLKDLRDDILSEPYKDNAPLWVAYHTAEVLIDIRDQLETIKFALVVIAPISDKPK